LKLNFFVGWAKGEARAHQGILDLMDTRAFAYPTNLVYSLEDFGFDGHAPLCPSYELLSTQPLTHPDHFDPRHYQNPSPRQLPLRNCIIIKNP
jgi:hypothetical protein